MSGSLEHQAAVCLQSAAFWKDWMTPWRSSVIFSWTALPPSSWSLSLVPPVQVRPSWQGSVGCIIDSVKLPAPGGFRCLLSLRRACSMGRQDHRRCGRGSAAAIRQSLGVGVLGRSLQLLDHGRNHARSLGSIRDSCRHSGHQPSAGDHKP